MIPERTIRYSSVRTKKNVGNITSWRVSIATYGIAVSRANNETAKLSLTTEGPESIRTIFEQFSARSNRPRSRYRRIRRAFRAVRCGWGVDDFVPPIVFVPKFDFRKRRRSADNFASFTSGILNRSESARFGAAPSRPPHASRPPSPRPSRPNLTVRARSVALLAVYTLNRS